MNFVILSPEPIYFIPKISQSTLDSPHPPLPGLSCLTVMLLGLRPFLMYYGPRVLLFEASTPFLNINYWLDKLGMTGGKLQLVNGVLLLAAFAGSRIVWGWGITWDFISGYLGNDDPSLRGKERGRVFLNGTSGEPKCYTRT